MKKILHIITGLNCGGAESLLYNLVINDKNNRHYVISLLDKGFYGKKLELYHIPLYCIYMKRGKFSIIKLIDIIRLIKTINPDMVQTWMYHADLLGGIASKLAGIKRVFWGIHNINLDVDKTPIGTRIVSKINSLLSYVLPSKIIACSEDAANFHTSLNYDKSKFEFINNGCNVDIFSPDNTKRELFRKKLNISDDDIVITMVARWDPMKDYITAINSLHHLRLHSVEPFKIIFAGSGITQDNTELVGLLNTHDLSDSVFLIGEIGDMPSLYNASDLLILSTHAESFGNVLIESMACGVPCIASDVGMIKVIIGDTGWVVSPNSIIELTNAMMLAISKLGATEYWLKKKNACRNRVVDKFSLKSMMIKYDDIWKSLF
jgi:glycosyltransferase involved in cell wall biosynthesis